MVIIVVVTLPGGELLYFIYNILLLDPVKFYVGVGYNFRSFRFGIYIRGHPRNCSFYVFLMLPAVMSQFFPNFKNPSVPDPNHQDIEIHGVSVWIICVGGCFYTVYKL